MYRLLLNTLIFTSALALAGTAMAEKPETPKGVAVSGEHENEQGATHGKSYAGSKEKKEKSAKKKDKKVRKTED